jgi:hypothetical protein
MANSVSMSRLLGFKDFFPGENSDPKEYYASHAGKELIETFCCYFLGFFRHRAIPAIPLLLQNWFTFMGRPYFSSPGYWHVISQYAKIRQQFPGEDHSILSEEALLNMFLWTNSNGNIPAKVDSIDATVMLRMFILNLLFNDDVLNNYQKAVDSTKAFDDRVLHRMFLATSFPQNDIINPDYAQLMYTQFYKVIHLLNFLKSSAAYQPLFQHLLNDFECATKSEFLKAIGGAIFLPFKGQSPGWTALTVDKAGDVKKAEDFLNKLTIGADEVTIDQNDYLALRDKPFQRLENGEYRVIFDLFLVKKMYNGLIFKLSDYSNKDGKLIKGFLGKIRDEFSEAVLVYDTLTKIFQPTGAVVKTGNEFKAAGLDREPDFYARDTNNIVLFESKDFYMPGASKLSYDFTTIEGELKKDGRLGKAVKQLKRNIERAITRQLLLDVNYDSGQVKIYPVIIVHDSLYSTPSLNYWVNCWLNDEIAALKAANTFPGFDYTNIIPVTLVEIDTMILYLHHFQTGQLNLVSLLDLYHQHVRLDLQGEEADRYIFQSVLPFSEFVRDYGYTANIRLNMDVFKQLYRDYGIT